MRHYVIIIFARMYEIFWIIDKEIIVIFIFSFISNRESIEFY